MTDLAEFLESLPPFSYLTEDEVDDLAAICEERKYHDGAVVAFQGDVADAMYIVRSGRLYAERRDKPKEGEHGLVWARKEYLPGDYFGEEWLLMPGVHPETVIASSLRGEPATVIVIPNGRFLNYLNYHPECVPNLAPEYDPATDELVAGLDPHVWEKARKADVKQKTKQSVVPVLPDELVEFSSRRSKYFLLVRLVWPFVGMIVVAGLIYGVFASQAPGTFLYNNRDTAVLVVFILFFVIILFRIMDWSNDYFLITNKRVVHREFDLRTFRIDIKTARIDQIQSVEIVTPSFLANYLHYGDAVIATASSFGTIVFDSIDHPVTVKETLDALTTAVKQIDSSRKQTLMRETLQSYFDVDRPYENVGDGENEEVQTGSNPPNIQRSLLRSIRNRFAWRIAEEGIITYRKHYIVLLFMTAAQLVGFALIFFLTYLITSFTPFTWVQIAPVVLILFLLDLGWFIWDVEDWRNDIFQVTDRMVIDIDRRPFGFGQSQKQAPLERIQNVNAYTPGLLHTIFNYGNVDIETAGDAINIEFDDVPYPSIIMSDIFARLDDLQEKNRKRQSATRHQEYALLIDIYKQSEEQNILPRRTMINMPPYPEEDEDES